MFTRRAAPPAIMLWTVLTLAGCGEDWAPSGTTTPPAVLSAASSTSMTGAVGEPVTDAPSVFVRDDHGQPLAGVTITFTVVSGGGTLTGFQARSDASGTARLGEWTLGTKAGLQTVAASSGKSSEVLFHATALPGAAYALRKLAGDVQVDLIGATLAIRPRVRVTDVYGNGLPGINVAFVVEEGGGALTSDLALTDPDGVAEAGSWILGSPGSQRMVARAGAISSDPFTATALAPPQSCASITSLRIGIVSQSGLTSSSCRRVDGRGQDMFAFTITAAGVYSFAMESMAFDTELELRSWDMRDVASNDDRGFMVSNSGFKAILRPGMYVLLATSSRVPATGQYSVSFRSGSEVQACEETFIVRGVITQQAAQPYDCQRTPLELSDRFRIFLEAGSTVTLQVDDECYCGPNVELITPTGEAHRGVFDSNYVVKLTYIAPVSGYYTFFVGLGSDYGTEYTLHVN